MVDNGWTVHEVYAVRGQLRVCLVDQQGRVHHYDCVQRGERERLKRDLRRAQALFLDAQRRVEELEELLDATEGELKS
jgi:hypothetical protein